jgi:hypothetical protein
MIRTVEIDPERQSAAGVAAGERALMRAVLEDAVRSLAGDSGPARTRIERAAEARAWFEEAGSRWPFAFENLCDSLGLCAEQLRVRVLRDAPVLLPIDVEEAPRPRRSTVPAAEITEMIRKGHPLRVVAEAFGISISKASILSCGLASRMKAERDEDIRALRAEGWTYRALAARFNLSRIRVMRICGRREREDTRTAA